MSVMLRDTNHQCLCCGHPFPISAPRQTRYCSERCREVYRGRAKPYVDKACGYCGVVFKVTPDSNKRYCSVKCKDKAQTVRDGGTPRPYDRTTTQYQVVDGKKKCVTCDAYKSVNEFGVYGKNNKYRSNCKACEVAYQKKRRATPEIKVAETLSRRLRRHAKRINGALNIDKVACYIRDSIKRGYQSRVVEKATGFTTEELKIHLEKQFTKGMSWSVFNTGAIHIDHIIPISSFDLSNPDEVRACWALSNLRPLWSADNLAKNAKILTLL